MSLSGRLLQSVVTGDFDGSSAVLLDMMTSLSRGQLTGILDSVIAELGDRRLVLRDHVASAFEMQPLYFSLLASCSEILTMTQTGADSSEARSALVSAIRLQLQSRPNILDVSRADTEVIGSGEYSVFLPHVLDGRVAQMKNVRVHTNSVGQGDGASKQYAIVQLWGAAYGRMVLAALEIPTNTFIVTSREWSMIDSALADAGFETKGIVVELGASQWLQELTLLRSMKRRGKSAESEMDLLDSLFWAREEIGYSDIEVATAAMETAQKCGSLTTARQLQSRAERGPILARQKAIEVLATMAIPGNEAFLERLLRDREDVLRPTIAQALSELTSQPFSQSARIAVRIAALTAKELPRVSRVLSAPKDFLSSVRALLSHRSQLVRDEGMSVLSSLSVGERLYCVDHLLGDPSETVRMATIPLVGSLPENEAKSLLERAARDDSVRIRKAAAILAESIGLD